MSQPLVSVIVPSYNHEKFISEAIQSIIDQDYPNIEFIIIDDGSKDNSVKIIESFRKICEDRFVRFEFRHRPNKGLCATLNEALEWVQGEYLCTVASDDIWMKEKTSLQVQYLKDNPNTVAVFGNMTLIDENGNIIEEGKVPFKRHLFKDIFLHRFYIPTPTNMSRTLDIKKTGGFNPNLIIEDWYMWLKLAESGNHLDCLPNTLAYYRRHSGNLSSNSELMHQGKMQIVSLFKSHNLYPRALKQIYKGTLNEAQQFQYALFKDAIISCPSLIYSSLYWRKAIELYKKKK